jgi:hypothetical protein
VTLRVDARLARLRRLATWLDDGIRIPGTKMRIGLDPIIGLLPGVGDAAGAIMAGAIVVEALRWRITRFTILRMAANVALDTVLGSVPIVGDLFDAAWKGNRRNMQLLERHLAEPRESSRSDRAFVVALGVALLGLCVAIVVGGAMLAGAMFSRLMSG